MQNKEGVQFFTQLKVTTSRWFSYNQGNISARKSSRSFARGSRRLMQRFVFMSPFRLPFAVLVWLFIFNSRSSALEPTRPVWLIGNGFHTSLVFRASDFPDASTLTGDPRPDALIIGWGATRFYQGHNDPISLLRAIFGLDTSALHVVPVRGSLAQQWSHSDLLRIELPAARQRALIREVAASFAHDSSGRLRLLGTGYFPDSRFYLARDRFYFPKVCNLWVAQKLQHAGLPLHGPFLIMAGPLIRRAAPFAHREATLHRPVDNF